LALALPALGALFLLVDPARLDERLYFLLHGICAQRPLHSFVVDGQIVAFEARMMGIFVGFAVGVGASWLTGGSRRIQLPSGGQAWLVGAFVAALGLDGLNATLFDYGGPALYVPRADLRYATGLLGGLGLAALSAPVMSLAFWRSTQTVPLFAGWRDLARALLVGAVLGLVAGSGVVPATVGSIVAALGVGVSFWLVNSYLWVLCWDGQARASGWADLGWAVLAGLALTGAELVGLAMLRDWVEAAAGIRWAI
jgi:uncharacterized membrane protein